MQELMRHIAHSPFWMAFVGAHFIVYSVPAWAIVFVRFAKGRMGRGERVLFAMLAGALLLEAVQLFADGFSFSGDNTWGIPRYFGVFAPLLWIWAAFALSRAWCAGNGGPARIAVRCAIVVGIAWVLVFQNVSALRGFYCSGARHDAVVAARRIAPVIQADYKGPARQAVRKTTLAEYCSTRRPVVFGDFSAAAWMVRGQSEGALQGKGLCPYEDDYLFIRVGSGYGGQNVIDSWKYDYVCSVRGGLGTEWRLFRRKRVLVDVFGPRN